ncbi:MAG TPA: LuxR C-terminal-related transcriptional regulator [Terriglobales bacterium]|nr:LuxR C-terminal-related transcriptional regulator [Terriglobales bacterium]
MRENSRLRNAVLETLWKSSLVGLAIYDAGERTLRDANGAFLDLLDSRYRTKKTLGTPLEQCLPEIEMSGLQEAFQRSLSEGVPMHADAVRFHRGPGASLLVNCMLLPMGPDGPAEGAPATALLLVASERKTELPVGESLNLVDNHTRQALARQFHLSAREIDIVGECLQGKKNRQIAQDLHIGISTVKRHLESAYRKMGISSSRSLPIAILNVLRNLSPAPTEMAITATAPPPQVGSQAA